MKGDVLLERLFYYISLLWIGSLIFITGYILADPVVTGDDGDPPKGVPSRDYSSVTWKSVVVSNIDNDSGKEIVDKFSSGIEFLKKDNLEVRFFRDGAKSYKIRQS